MCYPSLVIKCFIYFWYQWRYINIKHWIFKFPHPSHPPSLFLNESCVSTSTEPWWVGRGYIFTNTSLLCICLYPPIPPSHPPHPSQPASPWCSFFIVQVRWEWNHVFVLLSELWTRLNWTKGIQPPPGPRDGALSCRRALTERDRWEQGFREISWV